MRARSNSIKAFTLIELMIVIGLLSVVGGFFAVRTFQYLQERSFATEKEVVESRVQLANRMAILCDTTISPKVEGDRLTFQTTDRVPPSLAVVVKRPIRLKNDTSAPTGSAPAAVHPPQYPDEAALSSS